MASSHSGTGISSSCSRDLMFSNSEMGLLELIPEAEIGECSGQMIFPDCSVSVTHWNRNSSFRNSAAHRNVTTNYMLFRRQKRTDHSYLDKTASSETS